MRFIDANVFVYAVLKPRRSLTEKERILKERAKGILSRVDEGERVLTTVVHLSEVANVLEDVAGAAFAARFIQDLLAKENVVVEPVSAGDYLESAVLAEERGVSVNDALAYLVMVRRGVREVYTFDRHFERLDVVVVTE